MQQYGSVKSGEYFQIEIYGNQEKAILKDDDDYSYFLSILNKFLLDNNAVDLIAYCLKDDGVHMLLYQSIDDCIDSLVGNIRRDYDEYFFNKYGSKDVLNSGSCVVSKVDESLIMKASKNIHIIPEDWLDYPYSSIRAYLYDDTPEWLNKDHIVDLCGTTENYYSFVSRIVAK